MASLLARLEHEFSAVSNTCHAMLSTYIWPLNTSTFRTKPEEQMNLTIHYIKINLFVCITSAGVANHLFQKAVGEMGGALSRKWPRGDLLEPWRACAKFRRTHLAGPNGGLKFLGWEFGCVL